MAYVINAKTKEIREVENVVCPLTKEEVRQARDKLLAMSDWTQAPDSPVDQAAWAAYRQALRDIPQQAGFPRDVAWPEKP